MVAAWHPTGIEAAHAGFAHQHVLHGFVEGVAHVQHTGYVGRRDDDSERRPLIGTAVEIAFFLPVAVPFIFSGLGFKVARELSIHLIKLVCKFSICTPMGKKQLGRSLYFKVQLAVIDVVHQRSRVFKVQFF